MERVTITRPRKYVKIKSRNAKWLRANSGLVKKRNNAIRRDWLYMMRKRYTSSYIVDTLMVKYGISRRTVYNAVNEKIGTRATLESDPHKGNSNVAGRVEKAGVSEPATLPTPTPDSTISVSLYKLKKD